VDLMLNDGHLIPTFAICNRPLSAHYWTGITVSCLFIIRSLNAVWN